MNISTAITSAGNFETFNETARDVLFFTFKGVSSQPFEHV